MVSAGFTITGADPDDRFGRRIANAGDMNGGVQAWTTC